MQMGSDAGSWLLCAMRWWVVGHDDILKREREGRRGGREGRNVGEEITFAQPNKA